MVRLRKQARRCNFRAALEENFRDQLIEKLPNLELKKKLLEVNNITLEAAMEKVRKLKASREQASQMVMPSQEPGAGANVVEKSSGHGSKEKGVCFKAVVKRVILLRIGIVQLEVRSAVNVGNMVIMLAAANGGRNPKFGKQSTTQRRGGKQQRRGKGGQGQCC